MMMQTIISGIHAHNEISELKISDWRIIKSKLSRQERYFIRNQIEQSRTVDTFVYTLTVYIDNKTESGECTRGEATIAIQPSLTLEELKERIDYAAFAASKSKNPWFDVPGPSQQKETISASGFEKITNSEALALAEKALFSSQATRVDNAIQIEKPAQINSLELFLSLEEKEFLNSKGQSFSTREWKGYSEFVVDIQSPLGIVELFDDIEFSEPDPERLAKATGERLAQVIDRAKALPLPVVKELPVIMRGKEAEELFGWFFDNSTTSMIFMKASTFAVGDNVQSGQAKNLPEDPFDLWAEVSIPGLIHSCAFDADGFPLERTLVIEQGVLKTLIGSLRHADWLNIPRKGALRLFSVSPGAVSLEEMRSQPYLEPLMFSDFRLDTVTGDFGGEIRLAYYFDGKTKIPVTGGSISGSISNLRSTMKRSRERSLGTRSLSPSAILLHGVSITGIL
jgi:predicted Zn-dependent protease